MNEQWYCKIGDRKYGPLERVQLTRMYQRGQLTNASFVRKGKQGKWVPVTQVSDLVAASESTPTSASSAALPVAQPYKAPPVLSPGATPPVVQPASPAPPSGIPVGTAVTPATSVSPAGFAPTFTSDSATSFEVRKKKSSLPLVIGLTAALGILLVVGLVFAFRGGTPSTTEVVTAASARPEEADDGLDPITDIGDPGDPVEPTDPITPADAVEQPSQPNRKDAAQAVLASVDKWRDATRSRGVGPRGVFLVNVENAWTDLADDKPVLCVEISVVNTSQDTALNYTSSNLGEHAVLVGEDDSALEQLPLSVLPQDRRQTATIRPGETFKDVLVFAAPTGDYDVLKLALPLASLGRTGHYGFDLPKVMIGAQRKVPAEAVAATGAAGESPDATAEKPRDPDAPPSIDEINRSIQSVQQQATPPAPAASPASPAKPVEEDRPPTIAEINKMIEEAQDAEKIPVPGLD